jgi:phage baseplate assembly protein W
MAFNVEKINPLDLQPRKAVGVGLPFSAGAVFNSTYTTKDALKANLINFFLTEEGERYLNPGLGLGIRELLFDQMDQDTLDEVEAKIRTGIAMWFPNVTIANLQILESRDTNSIQVQVNYKIDQTNIQDDLLINFEQ